MKQKALFIAVGIVLLLTFVIGTLLYHAKPENSIPPMASSTPAASTKPPQSLPIDSAALIRMHSPTLVRRARKY